MNLEKFVVVSGLPGVHKLLTTRSNGVIIEDKNDGRSKFVPSRGSQLSLLSVISVYVNGWGEDEDADSVALSDVFQRVYDNLEKTPLVENNANSEALREYFTKVMPEHDQEKVRIKDIQKLVKWFRFMLEHKMIDEAIATKVEAVAADSDKAE